MNRSQLYIFCININTLDTIIKIWLILIDLPIQNKVKSHLGKGFQRTDRFKILHEQLSMEQETSRIKLMMGLLHLII